MNSTENRALMILNSLITVLARRQTTSSRAILEVLCDLKDRATPELTLSDIRVSLVDLQDQIDVVCGSLRHHEQEQERLNKEPKT